MVTTVYMVNSPFRCFDKFTWTCLKKASESVERRICNGYYLECISCPVLLVFTFILLLMNLSILCMVKRANVLHYTRKMCLTFVHRLSSDLAKAHGKAK